MADGVPKDYSSMYCEDSNSFPVLHHQINYSRNQLDYADLDHGPPPPLPPISSSRSSLPLSNHQRQQSHNNISDVSSTSSVTSSSIMSSTMKLKSLDGSHVAPKHREQQSIDLMKVVAKLQQLPKENHRAFAMDTLSKHYSSVFTNRKRHDQKERAGFRVYIQYSGEKDTFVVRVEQNTLRAIRDKMPKRGNYRYFFRSQDSTCEEHEVDGSVVPYHDRDGQKQIYCQVFPL